MIFIGDCELYENISPVTLWEEYGINSYIRGTGAAADLAVLLSDGGDVYL